MNHPFMYPDQCPWLDDYWELRELQRREAQRPPDDDDLDDPADLPPRYSV